MYRVEWILAAKKDLATIWINAENDAVRIAINQAVQTIDRRLERNPTNVGESRPRGRRILHEAPLGVSYRLEADDQTVTILGCWYYGKRRRP